MLDWGIIQQILDRRRVRDVVNFHFCYNSLVLGHKKYEVERVIISRISYRGSKSGKGWGRGEGWGRKGGEGHILVEINL